MNNLLCVNVVSSKLFCRDRKARQGRNPQTQESMMLPATVAPGFTPGKAFKDTVKAKHVHT